jgi:hypothetical protein
MTDSSLVTSVLPLLSRWAFVLVTTLSILSAAWLTQVDF